jgi:hypothetical protein
VPRPLANFQGNQARLCLKKILTGPEQGRSAACWPRINHKGDTKMTNNQSSQGQSNGNKGNFKNDRERAREAGRKGGQASGKRRSE